MTISREEAYERLLALDYILKWIPDIRTKDNCRFENSYPVFSSSYTLMCRLGRDYVDWGFRIYEGKSKFSPMKERRFLRDFNNIRKIVMDHPEPPRSCGQPYEPNPSCYVEKRWRREFAVIKTQEFCKYIYSQRFKALAADKESNDNGQ